MNKQKHCTWCGHILKVDLNDFCNPNCQTAYMNFTIMKIKPTLVDCICPGCQILHKSKIVWNGKAMPRIFCNVCIQIDDIVDSYEDDEFLLQ